MTAIATSPFPIYLDVDGSALENGYLYFGVAGQNSETNPITVYWDSTFETPAAQPIRTSGGYAVRNGTPAMVYFSATDYSITVRDKNRRLVYSKLSTDNAAAQQLELPVADVFTGNGATTVYTLSKTPSGQASLHVSIGGVTQTPGVDYTLTNGSKILTFTSAPPSGTTILVLYGQSSEALSQISYTIQASIATAGQTVFNLTNQYTPGANTLAVYLNGLRLTVVSDYAETSTSSITLTAGAVAGDELLFVTGTTEINPVSITASAVAYTPAGTGAVATDVQTKLREWVSVKDFGADPTGVADSTAAIQAALDSSTNVYVPPGIYRFSTLTLNKRGTRFFGAGIRSVLVHTGAGVAIKCFDSSNTIYPGGATAYVNDGQFYIADFALYTNGTIGIDLSDNRTTGSVVERMYMKPYAYYSAMTGSTYATNTKAISIDNTPWDSNDATYGISIRDCMIAGYQHAVYLDQIVNFLLIDNAYAVDCLNFLSISPTAGNTCTGIKLDNSYIESGVAASRGVVFGVGGGNQIYISNTSFELTNAAATQYAYDFSAGGSWTQVNVSNCKYLLTGDGNAVNSRRIIGTPPVGFLEVGRNYLNTSLSQTLPMIWAPGVSSTVPFQMPNYMRLGGVPGGNGRILLGRNGSDANDGYIENDGAYGLRLVGPGTGSLFDVAFNNSSGTAFLNYTSYTTPAFYPARDNSDQLGTPSFRWTVVNSVRAKLTPVAVASLPAAGTAGSGAKAFVSDSTATTFGAIVAGGGANPVPVYSDGTNWRIG